MHKKSEKKKIKKVAHSIKRANKPLRQKDVVSKKKIALKGQVKTPIIKQAPQIKSEITPFESIKRNFSRARIVVIWTFTFFVIAAVLALVFVQGGENSEKFNSKLQQASVMSLEDEGEPDSVTILATGDVLLARYIEKKMRGNKDYTYPFHNVGEFLKKADITFGNIESPFLPGYNTPRDSMTFRADPSSVEGLLFAGYDVVSIANNHAMNYKEAGLYKTLAVLAKAGIQAVGGGENEAASRKPAIIEVKGKKVAFLAYNDKKIPPGFHGEAGANKAGIAKMDITTGAEDVKNAKAQADFVVVSMHAGVEYKKEPSQTQKDFAHAMIDAGASVVIGHHTHVVQPMEYYNNGLILYSLGNFVFDQFFSEDVRNGLVVRITLPNEGNPAVELFPARRDTIQVRIPEGEERVSMLKTMGFE